MSIPTRLSPQDQAALEESLAEALDWVVHATGCLDMAPLFLADTIGVRDEFFDGDGDPAPPLPESLRTYKKGSVSRLNALAAWRVMVRWARARERIDPDFRRALDALCFSKTENRPPYRWSAKKPPPELPAGLGAHEAARLSKEGAWQTVTDLRDQRNRRLQAPSLQTECEAKLLERGCRTAVKSILKLEEQWEDDHGH